MTPVCLTPIRHIMSGTSLRTALPAATAACSNTTSHARAPRLRSQRSDSRDAQGPVCTCHPIEVGILRDDRQSMRDRGGRDQSIREADGALDTGCAAIVDQASPRGHHCFADRNRVGLSSESKSVGATGANVVIIGS
jgi:hypothetical protein